MKKLFVILSVVLMLSAVIVPVAFAQGNVQGTEIVDPVHLYVIGLVASAVVYGVKLLNTKYPKLKIKREWLTVILYVAALVLAVYWGGVTFPGFPEFSDPVTFVSALLTWFTALIAALAFPTSFATLIYNVLLKRVFDGIALRTGLIEAEAK